MTAAIDTPFNYGNKKAQTNACAYKHLSQRLVNNSLYSRDDESWFALYQSMLLRVAQNEHPCNYDYSNSMLKVR
ncbi:MAG: hypothetical protein LCI00_25270 [Chloroflexi bacterium]|nr:hypothetical protein [Chloroflexota bacterium]MCC6896805.1 hypothetical protein [Anaerolineae bacterium]